MSCSGCAEWHIVEWPRDRERTHGLLHLWPLVLLDQSTRVFCMQTGRALHSPPRLLFLSPPAQTWAQTTGKLLALDALDKHCPTSCDAHKGSSPVLTRFK